MKTCLWQISLLAFLFWGCKQNPFHPEALANHEWLLVQYGNGFGTTSLLQGSRITLRFEGDKISGNAGCNEYFGNWQHQGLDMLHFSDQIGATKKYCEGVMKQEDLYLRMLPGMTTFIVNDTTLELSGPSGFLFFTPRLPEGTPPKKVNTRILGYYTAGNEVSVFRDCADTTVTYWLEDETNQLDSIYKSVTNGEEYQPVLLEIEADKLPRLNLGYASEHDGLIRVKRILRAALPDPKDGCFPLMKLK